MALAIYNTLTRHKEPSRRSGPAVRMFGRRRSMTGRVGHAMSAVVFDVIRRYLNIAATRCIT
jgi:cysteinyl-tRNA synthetase